MSWAESELRFAAQIFESDEVIIICDDKVTIICSHKEFSALTVMTTMTSLAKTHVFDPTDSTLLNIFRRCG